MLLEAQCTNLCSGEVWPAHAEGGQSGQADEEVGDAGDCSSWLASPAGGEGPEEVVGGRLATTVHRL